MWLMYNVKEGQGGQDDVSQEFKPNAEQTLA
jgi:hypothetical protein